VACVEPGQSMTAPDLKRHRCPRPKCPLLISNALFCCHGHWYELPPRIRFAIGETAGLPVLAPSRRAAIEAAMFAWRAIDERAAR